MLRERQQMRHHNRHQRGLGINTEIGVSKPALPARQSNMKLRCQSISYGVRITVVDVGAGGAGVTTVVEARGGGDVVSVCTQPAKPMSANGNRNIRCIGSLPMLDYLVGTIARRKSE